MALLDSILFYIGSSTRKMEKEKRNDRREKKYLKRKKQASSASTDDSCPTIIQTSCFPFLNFSIIALSRILETVVTFHFSGGKVYSMNKGCHTCMIKHTMHVQSVHCSTSCLSWLDVCIYVPISHFHFLKRMLGKGQLRTA